MEKLTIKFNKEQKSLNDKKKLVSYLERHGFDYELEGNSNEIPHCTRCGSNLYVNSDCEECIRNSVGEVYSM